jgi:hypothetical protein
MPKATGPGFPWKSATTEFANLRAAAEDQQPVETLGADRAEEALGVGVTSAAALRTGGEITRRGRLGGLIHEYHRAQREPTF